MAGTLAAALAAGLGMAKAGPPEGSAVPVQGPVAPPQFGFYGTQWRRWNLADTMPSKPADNPATPARPPRSVVPDPPEEALAPPPGDAQPAARARGPAMPRPQPDDAAFPDDAAPGEPVRQPADREPLPPPADGKPAAQRPGAATLPKMDPQATGRFLAGLSRDAAAAKGAGPKEQAEFTQRLVGELLSAHDPEARRAIVETAGAFDTPAAAAICSGALEDPSPAVRMAACTVCARRGGADAVPKLSHRYATDSDLGVRLRALSSLADTGDKAAVATFVAALDDVDPVIRGRAIESLRRVSGKNLGDDADAWRRWANNPGQPTPRWSMTEAFRKLF